MDNAAGSVTISFADIYIQKVCKVLVDLHSSLLLERNGMQIDVLEVSYKYNFDEELFEFNRVTVIVHRMSGLTAEEQQALPEVRAEEVSLFIAEVIKKATADADVKDLKSVQDKLVRGLKTMGDADIEQLKAELWAEHEELLELMKTKTVYENHGRSLEYSLLISLATQRQTISGDTMGKFQLFATSAMREFIMEAKMLDDIDDLHDYIDELIQALESIENIIDKDRLLVII